MFSQLVRAYCQQTDDFVRRFPQYSLNARTMIAAFAQPLITEANPGQPQVLYDMILSLPREKCQDVIMKVSVEIDKLEDFPVHKYIAKMYKDLSRWLSLFPPSGTPIVREDEPSVEQALYESLAQAYINKGKALANAKKEEQNEPVLHGYVEEGKALSELTREIVGDKTKE